jgi:transcription termination factor Rho
MAAEPQLERSVLERKERDELRAIAQAMSLDTNSRSKKADIIDQILRAAGVEVAAANGDGTNGSSAAPARARSTRRAATESDNGSESTTVVAVVDPPGDEGGRAGTSSSRGGPGVAETPVTAGAANGTTSSPVTAPTATDDGDGAGDTVANASGTTATATSTETTTDDPSADDRSDGEPRAVDTAPRNGAVTDQATTTQSGSGPGPGSGSQSSGRQQQQGGSQHEPGNRRSRRRRNRDRSGGSSGGQGGQGGDRELQGGGQEAQYQGELIPVKGLFDLRDEGYGFLRADGYLPSQRDVYVSISQARRFSLRRGDHVEGASRPAASNERFPALIRIDTVNGLPADQTRNRPRFEDLTPLFPDSKLRLEMPGAAEVTTRIIDLLSPIGKGQRGLIVSPPKAGKTTVMKQIAHSIEANNPEVHLMVLLVDERPEEVTDMRRSVSGEVVASTFDRPADEHTAVAELAIERAKRLVEQGRDVVIILDGITRLARAYNLAQPATGRIMSGGVDSGALYPPKKFFGAARNIEEGGSLTILATALVETGSRMDEVIFEEFKGTGNMELRLDRRLAERRLYPSIDVNASSTRHEELLFERGQLQQVWKLRRVLNALAADGSQAAGLELLMDKIRTTKSNDEFLADIAKGPAPPS